LLLLSIAKTQSVCSGNGILDQKGRCFCFVAYGGDNCQILKESK